MAATRICVTFLGSLTARFEPTSAETSVIFGGRANYAAAGWEASSRHARVTTSSWVVLPWQAGNTAKILGLQVHSGPSLRVRLTRQLTAQAVIAASPLVVLTFPDLDAVTLLEVAGDGVTPTEFEWLAAGS